MNFRLFKDLKQGWATASPSETAVPTQAPATAPLPASRAANGNATATGEKQYLRLPVESARKLRWYERDELSALVRAHLREKRELQDCIAAMKKLMLRAGLHEADVDAEVQALVAQAEGVRESDEGVASVLLAAAQTGLEELQRSQQQLSEEVQQLTQQLAASSTAEASSAPSSPTPAQLPGLAHAGRQAELESALLALSRAVAAFEAAASSSASSSRRLRHSEVDLAAVEAAAAVQEALQAGSRGAPPGSSSSSRGDGQQDCAEGQAGGGEGGHDAERSPPSTALLAKLQRLEAERRQLFEEASDMREALAAARGAAAQAAALSAALDQSESARTGLAAALHSCQAELAAVRAAAQASEEQAERLGAEVKRLQQAAQGADALRRLQDLCLEAEERAVGAERRVTVLEARCGKSDASAREATAALRDKTKQCQQLQAELSQVEAALEAARKEAGAAAAVAQAAPSSPHQERVTQLLAQVSELEEAVRRSALEATAQRSQLLALQQRLQQAAGQEARLLADLHAAEEAVQRSEELQHQQAVLREHLADARAERGQMEHWKQVAAELEAGRGRLEEELVLTAQQAGRLEGRLRETLARVDAAETVAQAAEVRSRAAEASVVREVELRLAAAAANRSMWPAAIKEAWSALESRLEALAAALVAAQEGSAGDAVRLQQAEARQAELQSTVRGLEDRLWRSERELGALLAAAEAEVREAHAVAQVLRTQLARAEAERDDAARQASSAATALLNATSSAGLKPRTSSTEQQASSQAHSRWQVQNWVGGGSLYGVNDSSQQQQLTPSQPPKAAPPTAPGTTRGSSDSHTHNPTAHGLDPSQPAAASCSRAQPGGGGVSSTSPGPQLEGGAAAAPQPHPSTGPLANVNGAAGGGTARRGGPCAGPGGGGGVVLDGVELVYLRNLVMKFLEACLAGKVAERDALLPAVATLLQASPAEFQVLRKVVVNTTPPSVQVLSALGFRLPGS